MAKKRKPEKRNFFLITAENNAVKTNYVKAKVDNWQKNR